MIGNGEVQGDLGEFCDEALDDVDDQTIYMKGYSRCRITIPVPAGYSAVHCEDHGDHDHE